MQRNYTSNEQIVKRDIGSFVVPESPLFVHPLLRPRPRRVIKLMEAYEQDFDSEVEQELVQVYLRLKPCLSQNLYEVRTDQCLVTSLDTATAGHGRRTQHHVSKMYKFSHIFRSDATQSEVFEEVVKPNLRKLSEGHSFTLLTYGASGSGKTFTLMGTVAAPGLVPRSLEFLFRNMSPETMPRIRPGENGSEQLSSLQQQKEIQWVKSLQNIAAPQRDKYRRMSITLNNSTSSTDNSLQDRYYIWVSFVEIYNESVYDLLVSSDRRTASSKLRIREDHHGNVYVKGATQAFVRSGEEAYNVMVAGKLNLQVAATGIHAHSSRSHCIFTITLLCETESGVRTSCVRLCDLAGCERARNTNNTGARMIESRAINTSLHVLERCLHMLRNKNTGHVPYRESKLTRLLGAGLSGARSEAVSMVVTINPDPRHAMETRHVLQLAAIARDIQINNTMATFESLGSLEQSTIDTTVTSHEVLQLKAENERLHYELIQAQQKIKVLEAEMETNRKTSSMLTMKVVEDTRENTRRHYEQKYEETIKRLRNDLKDTIEENIVLQEKINELTSAHKLLKQEGDHLLACLESISEQSESPTEESANIEESDNEPDSDDDALNESLEPTFGKTAIRESKARFSLLPKKMNMLKPDSATELSDGEENFENSNEVERSKDTMCTSAHDNTFKNDGSDRMEVDGTEEIFDLTDTPKSTNSIIEKSNEKQKSCNVTIDDKSIKKTFDTVQDAKEKSLDVTTYVRNSDYSIEKKRMEADGTEEIFDQTDTPKSTNSIIEKSNEKQKSCNVTIDDKRLEKTFDTVQDAKEKSLDVTTYVRNSDYSIEKKPLARDKSLDVTDYERSSKNSVGNAEEIVSSNGMGEETYNALVLNETHVNNKGQIKENILTTESKDISCNIDSASSPIILANSTKCKDLNRLTRTEFKRQSTLDTSLSQFEKLEIATKEEEKKVENKQKSIVDFGILKVNSKDKKKYFDDVDTPKMTLKSIGEENSSIHNIVTDETNKVRYLKSIVNSANKANKTLLDETNSIIKECVESDKGNLEFRKDESNVEIKTRDLITVSRKGKNYFYSSETSNTDTNIAMSDKSPRERSPSIVQDEISEDFAQIKTKELINENISKEIGSLKKQQSLDLFDSPHVLLNSNEEPENALLKSKIKHIEKLTETNEKPWNSHKILSDKSETNEAIESENKIVDTKAENNSNELKSMVTLKETSLETKLLVERAHNNMANSEFKIPAPLIKNEIRDSLDDFEDIYKKITTPRPTEFDQLVTPNISHVSDKSKYGDKEIETEKKVKYNLRHKNRTDISNKEEIENQKEDTKINKKCLRLRRRKNQFEGKTEEHELKLKDIVNIQQEYSDVTLDVPAPVKIVKDIASPERQSEEDENLAPLGTQSCPMKSVTRSRRKLFTPSADLLDEDEDDDVGVDSNEKIRVPRPSYHRTTKARRKLVLKNAMYN